MSKHHSYFRNEREIDESEAFDRNGCLRDGVSTRVSMRFRDARMTDLQRAVAADAANRRPVFDAFGHPAGHRPGAVFTNDQAARDAKAAAYRQYDEEIGRAWQQTNPRGKSAAATGAGSNGPAAAIGSRVLIATGMTPHVQPTTAGVLSVATMPVTMPLLKLRFSKPKPITRAAAASTP